MYHGSSSASITETSTKLSAPMGDGKQYQSPTASFIGTKSSLQSAGTSGHDMPMKSDHRLLNNHPINYIDNQVVNGVGPEKKQAGSGYGMQKSEKLRDLFGGAEEDCFYGDTSKTKQLGRFMTKTGHCNIKRSATQLGKRYVTDIFTTLVDLQWKYNIVIFVLVYIAGWSLFGFIWWMIAYVRGDVEAYIMKDQNHTYCVSHVYSYSTAFLFYVETETSVGYGKRAITEQCPEAIFLFVFQAVLGSIVDAFMVGCIYIKLSQPKSRAATLVFSEHCVLTLRDKKYCLMFRVANLRASLLIQCRIRAKLVRSKLTAEGEFIGLHQDDINLGFDTGADNLFLVTPLIICHEIDHRSPFYSMSADDIKKKKFEIIVILEGMMESTGMICQARTSYTNSEIMWGQRFMPVLFNARGHISVDHSAFHTTYDVHMPSYSMNKFEEICADCEHEKPEPGPQRQAAVSLNAQTRDAKMNLPKNL